MSALYQARHIKRVRATGAELDRRRVALYTIVSEMEPMTVRQVFYQATVRNIVDKTESSYNKVQTDLAWMRRAGLMPYDWITDHTRYQRKPRTFNGIEQALQNTAELYRKALWSEVGAYVEIWIEKDALAGVVFPITSAYDVPLMSARGYASLSFLYGAADYIKSLGLPTHIYHFGDHDPSGVDAGEKIEDTLREMAPDADITFERVAVTREQIYAWDLPSRETKVSDSRAKNFVGDSVELDAIPPDTLRDLVESTIQRHLPPEQFAVLKAAEESERQLIKGLVGMALGGAR